MPQGPVGELGGPSDATAGEGAGGVVRADLHCHSHASSKPVNRLVGLLTNMPECYTTPEAVYDQAKARGMDLVTITDHDQISGAMELVERGFQDVFLGEEVSVYFPEDRCLLHVLVWGLTPKHHETFATDGLRDDVYAFAAYLREKELAHAFAHPLYVQNGKLSEWHLERACLLFKGWEALNGAHSGEHRRVVECYTASLTPERIAELETKHDLPALWPEPWVKGLTGGSDDHARLNIGMAWTGIERDTLAGEPTPERFLKAHMAGHSRADGVGGHSALLAHQLTTVAAHWWGAEKHQQASTRSRFVASRALRVAGVSAPSPSKGRLVAHEAKRAATGMVFGKRSSPLEPLVRAVRAELGPIAKAYPDLVGRLDLSQWSSGSVIADHERAAALFDDLTEAVAQSMQSGFLKSLQARDKSGITAHVASYLLVQLAQGPYIFSLFHQNKERPMIQRMEATMDGGMEKRPMKVLQFTDTLGDVNGVSRFIQNVAQLADENGRDLTVVTSPRFEVPDRPTVKNFKPMFARPMPMYPQLDAVLPPVTRMLRWAEKQKPDVIHVSTPGLVGGVGVIAAKMMKCPIVGTYHTDFPSYIDKLFDDYGLTKATELYMKLFYAGFSRVFSRSDQFHDEMRRVGINDQKMLTLISGIDLRAFGHTFKRPEIWTELGVDTPEEAASGTGGVKVLYCGRVSIEKNLPVVTRMWRRASDLAHERGSKAKFIVVGDGPYRAEMEQALRGRDAHFLGFRHGEELATLYASSDLFVFPSVTDTLGQSVMEAQASGLPAIVSDIGGPKSIVRDGTSGRVLSGSDAERWVDAIVELITDTDLRSRMSAGAIEVMAGRDIKDSFEHYWHEHERVWTEHLDRHNVPRNWEPEGPGVASAGDAEPSDRPAHADAG